MAKIPKTNAKLIEDWRRAVAVDNTKTSPSTNTPYVKKNTTSEFLFDPKTGKNYQNPDAERGLRIVSPEFELLSMGGGFGAMTAAKQAANKSLQKVVKNTSQLAPKKLDSSFMNKYYSKLKNNERLKQNRLFDDVIDRNIENKITEKNIEKAKAWDSKYGSNIHKTLSDLKRKYEYQDLNTNNKSPYPFDVNVFTKQDKGHNFKIGGSAGYKKISPEERMKRSFVMDKNGLKYIEEPLTPVADRILSVRKNMIDDPNKANRVVAHELGHIIEGNSKWDDAMKNRFSEIMKDPNIEIEKNIKNGIAKGKSLKHVEANTKLIEYYNTPTEISQHGVTNMRQELIDKGLGSSDGSFSKEHIDELFRMQENKSKMNYVGRDFFKYVDKSKSDKIAALINEYPKAIAPVAIGGTIAAKLKSKNSK